MAPFLVRWLLQLFATCFKFLRKQICNTPKESPSGNQTYTPPKELPNGFTCATCKVILNTICRFKDQSYCRRCRRELDSDSGAFSD